MIEITGLKADMHIHTCYSDGRAAPSAIVRKAKTLGFDIIAITDHDGVEGLPEALEAGRENGLTVIPGIELAAETADGTGLHILGYDFDREHPRLRETLSCLAEKREERNRKLISLLNDMGYECDIDELRKRQPNNYIGKPVIARFLAEKGYIADPKDAFKSGVLLESPEAKRIKKEKLRVDEAIALIKEAGGTAVLAHPIQIRGFGDKGSSGFYEKVDELIGALKACGLEGLECHHPDQDKAQTERFVEIAEKHGLMITRGSDFHGSEFIETEVT